MAPRSEVSGPRRCRGVAAGTSRAITAVKINRTQAVVLGFTLLAWLSRLSILGAAPEVLDGALRLPAGNRPAEIAFMVALSAFLALLAIGVVRRWRWTFWLVSVPFLAGLFRLPSSVP